MQRNSGKILFGILTVSDRCYKNEAVDESGPALKKILDTRCGNAFKTEVMLCVPDDITAIERVLRMWSDEKMLHVILTTGGTGPAPRDVTPEATQNVIKKKLPGMALAMAKGSLEKTPMAMLSRAICGIRNQTLIINLPGSKKGCTECLEFVIQSIPHAVGLIRNWVIEVSQTHNLLQTIDGVKNEKSETFSKDVLNESTLKETKNIYFPECIHEKTSKVDTSLVARRLRSSPYPMIRFEESLKILDNVVKEMPKISKSVAIRDAFGFVSSEQIFAEYNLPPFPASIKDGYAVKVSDGSGLRKVVADSIAGSEPGKKILKDGECVRINTGAPVPEGADAVVQVEDTELVAEDDDGRKEISINILIPPTVNQDIRPVGSDLKKGQIISSNNGIPLSSQDLALFAAAGVQNIQVFKRPTLAVFSTGNELLEPGEELKAGHVWDTNRLMLTTLIKSYGFEVIDLGIAKDNANEMLEKMINALKVSDIVITTGSVSMGDKDMLKAILKHDLNADIHFGRVNLKPGKPTTFATIKSEKGSVSKMIFGLPGNPVSAYVTLNLYVLRAVRLLSGVSNFGLTSVNARIKTGQKVDDREEFKRGLLQFINKDDAVVDVIGGCMLSSNILSCQNSNCLVRIPMKSELGKDYMVVNSVVECLVTSYI